MMPPPPHPADLSGLRQQVLDWYLRRQHDGWSAGDEQAFAQWLAQDARHGQAYAQWQAHSEAIDGVGAEALAQLRRNLQRDKAQQARPTRRRFLRPAFGLAAGLAVFGGTGLLVWQHQAQPVFQQAFSTPRGQQTEVSLPDGSRLRLDTATRLEVSYYRARREVRLLDGQAVFSVQADAARPFHVLAGPVGVTVVGTRFAVRHTPDLRGNDGVRVSVEEGKVRVVRREGAGGEALGAIADAILLQAGEQVAANAQGQLAPVAAVPGEGIALWRERRISFVDTPLAQALAELERYGRTGLTVNEPAVAALRLSGTFDPTDVQTFRLALPSALPVRLKPGNGTTEVVSAR